MSLLRLRWALRDAKSRWVQVVGIAFMIAIGTGMFAGLSSVTQWRIASNEASLNLTNMYDLRVHATGNSFITRGALRDIAMGIDGVDAAEERLVFETQTEFDSGDGSIFVPGRVIGVDMTDGGPNVNGVEPIVGRKIAPTEFGESVALIERNFGVFYELPDEGSMSLGGGIPARYIGQAVSPEYFLVVEEGSFFGQANLAVIFTSIDTAQEWGRMPGLVNDLVLTIEPGAERSEVEAELLATILERHPDASVKLNRREDDPSYLALTRDPEGDQQVYNVLALVLFAGAAFAALNFAARMVETQRREIGTSMALGMNPASIALRPLLVGFQIGALGIAFGVGVGLLIASLMAGVLEQFVALPVFLTPFQTGLFLQVAIFGFLLPIAAVLWPVFRATRVQPVDAIRTGHLAARGGGLAPFISRLPLPGSSLGRMPFRNLMRAPRRTFLTLFALTAVIAILFSVIGMSETFISTLARGDEEMLGDSPDRLTVNLDNYYPIDSPEVTGILDGDALRIAEIGLTISGNAQNRRDFAGAPDDETDSIEQQGLDVEIHFIDFESAFWRPTAWKGDLNVGEPGIVLARKAATDIGVGVGDDIVLTHPVWAGAGSFEIGTSTLPVIAIHPHPLRFNAYIDIRHSGIAGLDGFANTVTGAPASGQSLNDVKRSLFAVPGVSTVQGLAEAFKSVQDLFEQLTSIFLVIEIFVIGLAMLIAFNTANINADERARDHATMFAYGVSVRRVMFNLSIEGLVLGILATAAGIVFGFGLLLWMIYVLTPASYPDMGFIASIDVPETAAILATGIAVVALAPIFTVRKLQRMNVPSTLRVLE